MHDAVPRIDSVSFLIPWILSSTARAYLSPAPCAVPVLGGCCCDGNGDCGGGGGPGSDGTGTGLSPFLIFSSFIRRVTMAGIKQHSSS